MAGLHITKNKSLKFLNKTLKYLKKALSRLKYKMIFLHLTGISNHQIQFLIKQLNLTLESWFHLPPFLKNQIKKTKILKRVVKAHKANVMTLQTKLLEKMKIQIIFFKELKIWKKFKMNFFRRCLN